MDDCVGHDGPFRTVEVHEVATLTRGSRFNHDRLRSELDYVSPVEYQNNYYNSQKARTPTGTLVNQ